MPSTFRARFPLCGALLLTTRFFLHSLVAITLLLFGAVGPAFGGTQRAIADIRNLLTVPEKDIDIGVAALTLAKEIYPELDIELYSQKIDALVDKSRRLAKGSADPEYRIRVLNTVIYLQEGFRYDRSPLARAKQEYYFLNGILDTKLGLCYSMPLLYLAVAQRLNYPIYPVAAPDHLFVRYVDPPFKQQNIETTSGGKYFPDEVYIRDFSVGESGLKSGSYMRTLSYREFLGHMLGVNAFVLGRRGDGVQALRDLENAVKLDPTYADHHYNLQLIYLAASKAATGDWPAKYRERSRHHALKAQQLGYVGPEAIAIGKEVRGK